MTRIETVLSDKKEEQSESPIYFAKWRKSMKKPARRRHSYSDLQRSLGLVCLIIATGCQSPVTPAGKASRDIGSLAAESHRYAQDMVMAYRVICEAGGSARLSVKDPTISGIADYFDHYPVIGPNEEGSTFSDLPKEQKEQFLVQWRNDVEATYQSNAIDRDLETSYAVSLHYQSDAMESSGLTDGADRRPLLVRSELYRSQLRAATSRGSDSGHSSDSGPFEPSAEAFAWIVANHHPGYIISMFGTQVGGLPVNADTVGHCGLLGPIENPNLANPKTTYDKATTIGIAAYATGGVQKDELSRWTNKNSWYKRLTIGRPRYKYWKWNWFGSGYKYDYPSDDDYSKAVANALEYLGRPYDSNYLYNGWLNSDLNSKSSFWCSKLVWRAWYSTNTNYDLNYGHNSVFGLSPADIYYNADRYQNLASFSF